MSWKVYRSGIFGFLHELFGFLRDFFLFFHNFLDFFLIFFLKISRFAFKDHGHGFVNELEGLSQQPCMQADLHMSNQLSRQVLNLLWISHSRGKFKNRLSPGNSSATRSRRQVLATTWSAQTSSAAGVQIPPVFSKSKKQGPRDPGIQQSAREVRAFANSQPSGEASRDKWGEPVQCTMGQAQCKTGNRKISTSPLILSVSKYFR